MLVYTESQISSPSVLLLTEYRSVCAMLSWAVTTAAQTEIRDPIVFFIGAVLGEVCEGVFWRFSVAVDVDVWAWVKTGAVVTKVAGSMSCDFKGNQVTRECVKGVRGWIKSSHHGDLFL